MTDRPPIPQETVATRAAFRAGVKGMRYTENPDPGFDIPVATDNAPRPNDRHFETIERLPGLSDPETAYEAGRALRMIGHILDSQRSPVEHGRIFCPSSLTPCCPSRYALSDSPGALIYRFRVSGDLQGPTRGRPEGARRDPRYASRRPIDQRTRATTRVLKTSFRSTVNFVTKGDPSL